MSRALLAGLRRQMPLLVLLPLTFALIALILVGRPGVPSHVATADVYVTARAANDPQDFNRGALYVQRQMLSLTALARSSDVLEPVIADLKLSLTPGALARQVTVEPTSGSVLQISVRGSSASEVLTLSSAVSTSLASRIEAVAPSDESGNPAVSAQVLASSSMVEPTSRPWILTLMAGLAGLILAVSIALYRYATNRLLNSADDVREITTAPVLAEFGRPRRGALSDKLQVERLAYAVRNGAIDAGVDTAVVAETASGRHASNIASTLARALSAGTSTCVAIDAADDLAELVDRARHEHDLVLIAQPSSRPAIEASQALGVPYGLLAVVETGVTQVSTLIDLLRAAEGHGVEVLGVVTVGSVTRRRLHPVLRRTKEAIS